MDNRQMTRCDRCGQLWERCRCGDERIYDMNKPGSGIAAASHDWQFVRCVGGSDVEQKVEKCGRCECEQMRFTTTRRTEGQVVEVLESFIPYPLTYCPEAEGFTHGGSSYLKGESNG